MHFFKHDMIVALGVGGLPRQHLRNATKRAPPHRLRYRYHEEDFHEDTQQAGIAHMSGGGKQPITDDMLSLPWPHELAMQHGMPSVMVFCIHVFLHHRRRLPGCAPMGLWRCEGPVALLWKTTLNVFSMPKCLFTARCNVPS